MNIGYTNKTRIRELHESVQKGDTIFGGNGVEPTYSYVGKSVEYMRSKGFSVSGI